MYVNTCMRICAHNATPALQYIKDHNTTHKTERDALEAQKLEALDDTEDPILASLDDDTQTLDAIDGVQPPLLDERPPARQAAGRAQRPFGLHMPPAL